MDPGPPSWVQAARRLPRVRIYGCSRRETPNPSYAVTSLGPCEFFEFTYTDGTKFVIDHAAHRLWGTFSPPLTFEDFAVYLRGPIMGFILRRRGVIALHASALFPGHAIVLCGPSESGKSTTAAAMAIRGIPVLSDDIAAINTEEVSFQIEAGYPRICIWPEAVRELLGATDALPRLTPTWDKRFLPVDGTKAKFKSQKSLLGGVYLLSPRAVANAPRIEEVSPRQALLELVQNTYMNWLLNREQRAAEFEVLSNLVTTVPVRRIVAHIDPARIAAVCDLILRDSQSLRNHQGARSWASGR